MPNFGTFRHFFPRNSRKVFCRRRSVKLLPKPSHCSVNGEPSAHRFSTGPFRWTSFFPSPSETGARGCGVGLTPTSTRGVTGRLPRRTSMRAAPSAARGARSTARRSRRSPRRATRSRPPRRWARSPKAHRAGASRISRGTCGSGPPISTQSYTESDAADPTGPASGAPHVMRGFRCAATPRSRSGRVRREGDASR